MALILKHANKNRLGAVDGAQTILMYATATAVSVNISVSAGTAQPWFWTISAREYPRSVHRPGYSATREQAIADFKSFPRGCQTTAGYPFSYAVSAGKTKRTENQNCSKHHARFLNC